MSAGDVYIGPTNIDNANATKYAWHMRQARILKADELKPMLNAQQHYTNAYRPDVDGSLDYFCPPGLDCPKVRLRLTKAGCLKTSCVPFDSKGNALHYKTNRGDHTTSASCWAWGNGSEAYPVPGVEEMWWDEDTQTCMPVLPMLHRWAVHPSSRREPEQGTIRGVTDVPPFGWNPNPDMKKLILITEEYCRNAGLHFDADVNDCYRQGWEVIPDFLIGGLYRELRRGMYYASRDVHDAVDALNLYMDMRRLQKDAIIHTITV